MTIALPFENTYADLPERFYTRQPPTPVSSPRLIALNEALAHALGMDSDALRSPDGLSILAGNAVPTGATPLAQVYAGHQFGGWSPQLGDGRALLLGEIVDPAGHRWDVQLKGSGPTPYSRMGDGRAWLGPVMREYIVSEAMHALGIPSTRALAAVATGDTVFREAPLPGAILTRVATSHIRVGTFQYFAAREDHAALQALTDYVIQRHYPDAETALDLLAAVIARQARLVAQWMSVGFIHGVMNTDNAHIAGETIDYGPCAFMDAYQHDKVFSSIDRGGRYAYGRQPQMAVWNMAQLASALLPLIDADLDAAVEQATEVVNTLVDLYQAAWLDLFRSKLGLTSAHDEDADLILSLLTVMEDGGADFTNTFRALSNARALPFKSEAANAWQLRYDNRLMVDPATPLQRETLMLGANPAVIPRNHRIEAAIQAGVAGDFDPFHALVQIVRTPFELSEVSSDYANPPRAEETVHQTFCGT